MMSLRKPLLIFPGLAILVSASLGQSVLYTFDGNSGFDKFGAAVSGAGDVNGDGIPDMIVGAFKDNPTGAASGSARVLSGMDGSILYTFDGDSGGDWLGYSVSGAGDVNGDGFDDLIVGAWHAAINGPESGYARVYSGVDGSVLHTFNASSRGDWFGYSVSGAGDVNGDGLADLIVGAPRDEPRAIYIGGAKATDRGSATVYSGANGSVLRTFFGRSDNDQFGFSVSCAGDVNGDGVPDIVVGAVTEDTSKGPNSGSVRVFSGLDGKRLHRFKGHGAGALMGWSVSGAGDVNGDGFADLIVGAIRDNYGGIESGSAQVFSGADGAELHLFVGDSWNDWLGYSVSGAGDVNGDGFDDLIVGAPGTMNFMRGYTKIVSGRDGKTLHRHQGVGAGDWFGVAVAGVGDVNGDGFADFMIGSYLEDSTGQDSGSARVFSGCDALATTYCSPAVANSTGVPAVITACGSPQAKANGGYFMLRAADLPPDQFGYFLASETQGFVPNPGGSQGNLCLSGDIGRFSKQIQSSGPGGAFTIQVDLANIPTTPPHSVLAGETWNFQAWFRDSNPGNTSNFTDAVSVLFL